MRSLLIVCGLVLAGIAGCLGTTETVTQSSGDGSDTSDGNNTTATPTPTPSPSPTDPATNTPPSANMTLSASNGTAPLNVTFNVTASDADGDTLTWTIDFGDGNSTSGDELPAQVANNFTFGGNFTVTLKVSDGEATAVVSRLVTVQAPDAPPAEPMQDDYVIFNADGTCTAKDAVSIGPLWLNDRPGAEIPVLGENPAGGDWPYGTGFLSGGGTWVYEESNGIHGLQLGGSNDLGSEVDAYVDCANPDTLLV